MSTMRNIENRTSQNAQSMANVYQVIDKLLEPEGGCPWDKEQNPLSLCEYIVEECHEMVDAIRQEKVAHVVEELGDLLFLLLFTAHKYEEAGAFSLPDALEAAAAKLTRRHPHVFGDAKFEDKADFTKSWEAIKKAEKAGAEKKGVFASVPEGLPPLTKAYRLHAKAANVGFTWPDDEEVERQVEAEWLELLDAAAEGKEEDIEHELGDIIFTLAEYGRRKGIKAAHATALAGIRFQTRFEAMEALAQTRGLDFNSLSLDDKDELWEEVKSKIGQKTF